MLSAESVTAWQEVLQRVEKKTTAQQFATWFRSLTVDSLSARITLRDDATGTVIQLAGAS